jgi:D-alanyl-lipoteichoic acid acyltransferase DltB (MBOAT superfamily)
MSTVLSGTPGEIKSATELARGRIGIRDYALVLLQLALLTLLLRQFQIESAAFLRLALLAFAGFAVHALLPLRYRLPFFLALSLAGIVVVLEPVNGLSIIAIGVVLIGICHLPVSFRMRAILLVGAGALLVALRAKWIAGPVPEAIWPILGSMFMFRLIVYFYDLRHDTATPASPVRTLAYFFMLPNACFPLFPVVDYQAFRRNYYDDDAYRTYQTGVDWMLRGVVHLILYRAVYYHLTLAPSEVTGPAQLLQFLVTNFLLYLRVSGLFHLVVGMLYLFGFRLPETHNRYLLASSFTDFWRRINIYWKDFMQRIFYYPTVFRLRKLGTARAMVLATLLVFTLTWFLHAYQWFWLRGTLLFAPQDILFWTILGCLVVVNALYELKHGRERSLSNAPQTWRSLGSVTLKTFATFWAICVLWSFWTTDSLGQWLSLWSALKGPYTWSVLLYPALVLAVIVIGSVERNPLRNIRPSKVDERAWLRARLVTAVSLVVLVGVSIEGVHQRFGTEVATTIHSLRSGHLSRLDMAKLERGYYENLLSVDRFNSQLWEVYSKRPANWLDVQGANLKRFTGGFAQNELIPSFVSSTPYGTISTNRWGMRDKDYERTPPPNTFRIAILGASTVMGWGVGDGETFESLLEEQLNREKPSGSYAGYEILNFGVPGHQPPQELVTLDYALSFKPNAVYYVATTREISRAESYLIEIVQKKVPIPYEPLREIIDRAGLDPSMDEATALKRLRPFGDQILSWIYRHMADDARSHGAAPVFVFLPALPEELWQDETAEILRIAGAAGFPVIDLTGVYKGQDVGAISLAEWDHHPNRRGHELIAARLNDSLRKMQPSVVGSGVQAPSN